MKKIIVILLMTMLMATGFVGCGSNPAPADAGGQTPGDASEAKTVDEYSFNLGNFDGTVGAFCEVIMRGSKDIAFSDPFVPEDQEVLEPYVKKKCENYGVKYYVEKNLLLTKLYADVEMDGAYVFILYQDEAVLDQYKALQAEEAALIEQDEYTEEKQVDLARRYGKLMGYSDKGIADAIGE